jgi:AraC-like DNA-binding protein
MTPTSPAVAHQTFATRDPDVAHDYLRRTYADYELLIRGSTDAFAFDASTLVLDDILFGYFHHTMAFEANITEGLPAPACISQTVPSPIRISYGSGQRTTLEQAQSLQIPAGRSHVVGWEQCRMSIVMMSSKMLSDAASQQSDRELSLHFGVPVSSAAQNHWSRVTAFVQRVAQTTATINDQPLLRHELAGLISSAALSCFPNSVLGAAPVDSVKAMPTAVRRAVSHIDEHIEEPITLGDLAEAARISPRALQAAFRRHLGTTPLSYLRAVRMGLAHRDLQAAEPGSGRTVAEIAGKWGFPQLSRFARDHYRRYGVLPRDLLRTVDA